MSDDLKLNKILGAGLATALIILGVREISMRLYEREPLPKDKFAYAVAGVQESAGPAEVADTLPDWGTVLPTADIAAGEKTFAKCMSCHNNAAGGPNLIGPNLNGVVGRPPASHAGFAYSDGMQAHAKTAPNWTYDELYQFIKGPQAWVAGTKMSFAGLKPSQDRINLIAYLRSQGSAGYPIPAPDPKRAPAAAAPAGAAGTTTAPSTAAGQATGQAAAGTPTTLVSKPGDSGATAKAPAAAPTAPTPAKK